MLYAVAQGFFLGAASEAFENIYSGIVAQAVAGTVAAFVATLAAYKFFNIQVSDRFRKFVVIAGLGFFIVTFFDFILYLFGNDIGFNDFGTLGLIMSVVGLALGVFFLILDFDMVEQGVRVGAPERSPGGPRSRLTATLDLHLHRAAPDHRHPARRQLAGLTRITAPANTLPHRGTGVWVSERPSERIRGPFVCLVSVRRGWARRSLESAVSPPQIVLVDDRGRVPVRESYSSRSHCTRSSNRWMPGPSSRWPNHS